MQSKLTGFSAADHDPQYCVEQRCYPILYGRLHEELFPGRTTQQFRYAAGGWTANSKLKGSEEAPINFMFSFYSNCQNFFKNISKKKEKKKVLILNKIPSRINHRVVSKHAQIDKNPVANGDEEQAGQIQGFFQIAMPAIDGGMSVLCISFIFAFEFVFVPVRKLGNC